MGTGLSSKRFNAFEISKVLNIPTALYMKPVLKGIKKNDIELYKEVIQKYVKINIKLQGDYN